MSKIYEALLRAEKERTDLEQATEDDATHVVVPLRRESVVATAPKKRALTELRAEDVRVEPWNPSLKQLPALEVKGSAVEQFRTLRSRMQEFRELGTLKTVLVSSGRMNEGKSFVSANLAISLARHKASRVLLIDGDMRRSTLHHLLGCVNEPGLTEFLSGKASMLEVMQRSRPELDGSYYSRALSSLTFIPGGADAKNAADLSGNKRFEELISAASSMFDWIIVDSSPVNLVADGVNLARACDGVILVARGGVTGFEIAQKALAELKASRMLGVVLNAVPDAPQTEGYYGYEPKESDEDSTAEHKSRS